MGPINKMLVLVFAAFLINFSCVNCSSMGIKPFPEHKGVDPKVADIVKEYKELAKMQGITFINEVTIGFKKIDKGNVIGLCTRVPGWREIDIDDDFYKNSTQTSRMIVVYHELSHCYCERAHDHDNGVPYPETAAQRIKEVMDSLAKNEKPPGRFEDGCPNSILYPVILDDDCTRRHYGEYVKEMFNRCVRY